MKEFQDLIIKYLSPVSLLANVLHPEFMGKSFFDKNCTLREESIKFFRQRFEILDPIVMFRQKRGVFWECFDGDGKLTIPYRKFWPKYRLDYTDISLFAEGILNIPAKLPDINLIDICLRPISNNNCDENVPIEDRNFLFRFLKLEQLKQTATTEVP